MLLPSSTLPAVEKRRSSVWEVDSSHSEDWNSAKAARKALTAPLLGSNSAAYLGMRFGGVLLGNGSKPGDVLNDTEALARAKTFFAQDAPLARFPYETR